MNLHALASPVIGVVNPNLPATLRQSTGYTLGADGTQIPSYTDTTVTAQIQSLSYRDLVMVQGLNLNGEKRAIYLNGHVESVNRQAVKGGDLIVFPDGTTWVVAQELETWGNAATNNGEWWCKVAVTLQIDTP